MPQPYGKPLLPPNSSARAAAAERRIGKLEQRGTSRWVYLSGSPASDPGGIDATFWTDDNLPGHSFTWLNGWGDTGGDVTQADGLTRYRMGWNGLEFVINAVGGSLGTIMFTLLAGYWDPRDGKQTYTAADASGGFTCYTVIPRSDYGQCADVYAGRV